MITVSKTHARRNLSSLIREAENGEVVTITEHGQPKAVLISVVEAGTIVRRPSKTKNFGEFLVNYQSSDEMASQSRPIEFND